MASQKRFNVAVVGATGAVGTQIIKILEQRNFPIRDLKLLASGRSAGTELSFNGDSYMVEELYGDSFENVDIALFSAGGSVSKEFAPIAADSNAVVIDNTSAFRMNEDVPLVVPEINPEMIEKRAGGIIANPNCSTIQMVVALKPLHDFAKIKRIVVSTYQAVSGAGNSAINELSKQTEDLFKFQDIEPSIFPHQIAFNILPHIDLFLDNHYTKEEMKMVNETRKIFNDYSIGVTATCVRVPVFIGHAESVNVEFHDPITPDQAKKLLKDASGVTVVDNPNLNQYPLPLKAADKDDVFVGRIRQDESVNNGLNLWIVADNLRKGAALNAVQIGEKLIEEFS